MMNLPDKDPAESVVVEFDFTNELTSIASAAIAVTSAQDPSPTAILTGALQISGTKVLQRIDGGLDRANYKLKCTAVQGNNIRVLASTLPVREA